MREVDGIKLEPYAVRLKVKKNDLRSVIERTPAHQAGELQLEYAETCKALGYWYKGPGYETLKRCEFGEAAAARWNAASNCHNIRYY